VHEFLPDQPVGNVDTTTQPYLMMCSMIDLSIHLGGILKLLYSPCKLGIRLRSRIILTFRSSAGIMGIKEEQLYTLQEGLEKSVKFNCATESTAY